MKLKYDDSTDKCGAGIEVGVVGAGVVPCLIKSQCVIEWWIVKAIGNRGSFNIRFSCI